MKPGDACYFGEDEWGRITVTHTGCNAYREGTVTVMVEGKWEVA